MKQILLIILTFLSINVFAQQININVKNTIPVGNVVQIIFEATLDENSSGLASDYLFDAVLETERGKVIDNKFINGKTKGLLPNIDYTVSVLYKNAGLSERDVLNNLNVKADIIFRPLNIEVNSKYKIDKPISLDLKNTGPQKNLRNGKLDVYLVSGEGNDIPLEFGLKVNVNKPISINLNNHKDKLPSKGGEYNFRIEYKFTSELINEYGEDIYFPPFNSDKFKIVSKRGKKLLYTIGGGVLGAAAVIYFIMPKPLPDPESPIRE